MVRCRWFVGRWFVGRWFVGRWFVGRWFVGRWFVGRGPVAELVGGAYEPDRCVSRVSGLPVLCAHGRFPWNPFARRASWTHVPTSTGAAAQPEYPLRGGAVLADVPARGGRGRAARLR